MRVHIRWMIRRDMPEVHEIERRSFQFAWSEEDFIKCLRQRNCIGIVAEHDEQVVAFMIYELHKERLEVLDFAVHPDARRQGVGTTMVGKLKSKLSPQRRSRLAFDVWDNNLSGHLFMRAMGFRAVSVIEQPHGDPPHTDYRFVYRAEAAVTLTEPSP